MISETVRYITSFNADNFNEYLSTKNATSYNRFLWIFKAKIRILITCLQISENSDQIYKKEYSFQYF